MQVEEGHVEKNAKKIAFWDGSSWKDIEVDKATFDRCDIHISGCGVKTVDHIQRQRQDVGVMGGHHSVMSLRDLDCSPRTP